MSIISLDRPFGGLIPISLDTSNIIDLGYESIPSWYPVFQEMKQSRKFTFCLSDVALGELIKPIYEESHDWSCFKKSISRVSVLLDKVIPILPGGVDMEKLCGMDIPREASELSVEQIIKRSQILWRKIYEANRVSEIADKKEIYSLKEDLKLLKTRYQHTFISPENTAQELGLDLGILPFDKVAQGKFAEAFRAKFSAYKAREFTVDQVIDLYLHLRIQLFIEFTRKQGYNPMKKKDNHPYDLLLFEALPLPAIILVDKNMYNRVQQTSSYQKSWVYTADGLAQAFQNGLLCNLELNFE